MNRVYTNNIPAGTMYCAGNSGRQVPGCMLKIPVAIIHWLAIFRVGEIHRLVSLPTYAYSDDGRFRVTVSENHGGSFHSCKVIIGMCDFFLGGTAKIILVIREANCQSTFQRACGNVFFELLALPERAPGRAPRCILTLECSLSTA